MRSSDSISGSPALQVESLAVIAGGLKCSDDGQSRADEKLFTGRTEALEKIGAYLRVGNAGPLAVCGVSGSGKSTVMARAVAAAQAKHPQAEIIFRFIGVTPESTQARALLESLCRQISSRYGMERPVPTQYLKLCQDFSARLEDIPANKPLYLFLDALDQLSNLNNARSLNWLPIGLPSQVRLVVSTSLDSPCCSPGCSPRPSARCSLHNATRYSKDLNIRRCRFI